MTFQRSWPFSRGLLMVHYDNLTCSLPADISKVVNCFKKAKTSIWKYSYMFMGLLCIFIEMDFSFLQNHVWFLHLSKKMRSQLFYLILTQRDVNVFFFNICISWWTLSKKIYNPFFQSFKTIWSLLFFCRFYNKICDRLDNGFEISYIQQFDHFNPVRKFSLKK